MRKGTLSDAETLSLVEHGAAVIAICVKEGMTPYGVYSRLYRARKHRRLSAPAGHRRRSAPRTRTPQPTLDSFDALRRAVEELEEMTRPRRRAA